MRKYLENIKDIEALKDTDTVIHYGSDEKYVLKFVNGVLCAFDKENTDRLHEYNFPLNIDIQTPYIEVEGESSEDCIGKLGWFWNSDGHRIMDRLEDVDDEEFKGLDAGEWYSHFCPLTPEEVEEYTGYKVVKED